MKRRIFLMTLVLLLVGALMLGLAACNGGNKGNGGNEACEHSGVTLTETKAATCLEAGQRSGTCPDCGEPVTETIPALGHNRVDGWCDACSTGLYTNLVMSATEQSLGVYLSGLKLSMHAERVYYDDAIDVNIVDMEQVGTAFLTFALNEDFMPVLKGKVVLKADIKEGDKQEPYEYQSTLTMMVEYDGKNMYGVRLIEMVDGEDVSESAQYVFEMQDEAQFGELPTEALEILGEIAEKLSPVLEPLMVVAPKMANQLIANTYLRMFNETVTDTGYTYTFSAANLSKFYDEIFSDKTIGAFIEEELGKDFVADLLSLVKEYAVLTPAECYDKLRAKGVAPEDIFPLIDRLVSSLEDEEIDSEEIFTADAIMNRPLFDLVMGNTEGDITADADIIAAIDTLYNEQIKPVLESTFVKLAQLDEDMVEMIAEQLDACISAILEHVDLSLTLDKEGVLTGAAASVSIKDVDLIELGIETDQRTTVSKLGEVTGAITVKVNPEAPEKNDLASTYVDDLADKVIAALVKEEFVDEDEDDYITVAVADGKATKSIIVSEVEGYEDFYDYSTDALVQVWYSRDYRATATISKKNLVSIDAFDYDQNFYRVYLNFAIETVISDELEIVGGYSYETDEELDAEEASVYFEQLKEELGYRDRTDNVYVMVYYNIETGEITLEAPAGSEISR